MTSSTRPSSRGTIGHLSATEHYREQSDLIAQDLDHAVLAANGWSDVHVPPFPTPETDADRRVPEALEDEVIDRHFLLKAERAAGERRLGLAAAGKGKGRGRRVKKATWSGQGGLFG